MTYSRRNILEEQQEAHQRARQITEICEQFSITLDPIDWQQSGMRAPVTVNTVEIAPLQDLNPRDSDYVLRRVQIRLFEHAARETINASPDLKALIWSPVEVVQPQDFLSLWVITFETDQRVPIVESIKDGRRVYEYYNVNYVDAQRLAGLFGPMSEGEYQMGEQVTIQERENQYTGEVVYIIPPARVSANRKYSSRGFHTVAGKSFANDTAARYIVDCHDGFPHIVKQSQIIDKKIAEEA